MKRILPLMLAMIMLLALAACGSSGPAETDGRDAPGSQGAPSGANAPASQGTGAKATAAPSSATAATQPPRPTAPPFSEDDLEFTDYSYATDVSTHAFRIVKNHGEATVKITGSATAKDADGNELGTEHADVIFVGPGQTSIIHCNFWKAAGVAAVDYDLDCQAETFFYPIIGDLAVETAETKRGIIARVTNNGEFDAIYPDGYALFFDASGQLIDSRIYPVGNSAGRLPPNAAHATEFETNNSEFDHTEFYLSSHADGSRTDPPPVSEKDLAIREFRSKGSYDSETWFQVITNNSSYDLDVEINAIAYSAEDSMISASTIGLAPLAAGQTGINWLSFFKDDMGAEVDHVDYTYGFNTEPMGQDARPFLALETRTDAEGADISVTNNGPAPAEYVQVYAVFFDEQGNCVGISSDYVRDDDRVLKNGDTITIRLKSREPFATVEFYLSGRFVK